MWNVNTWMDIQKEMNTFNFDFNFELFEMYILCLLPVCKWVEWIHSWIPWIARSKRVIYKLEFQFFAWAEYAIEFIHTLWVHSQVSGEYICFL